MNKLKRVIVKEELVAITGNFVLAIILNQFIYWSYRVIDSDKMLIEEKERAEKDGYKVNIAPDNGWIYKKAEELVDETMLGVTRQTMRTNVKKLVHQGYLFERCNPKYKWDKTKQYRVNFQKINDDLYKKGYTIDGHRIENGTKIGNETKHNDLTFECKKIYHRGDKNLLAIPEITSEITSDNKKEYSNEYSINAHAREEKTKEKIQFQKAVDYVNSKISCETIREKIFNLFKNRIKANKTITIEVAKQILMQLDEFSSGDYDTKIALLDRSIENGYYSIFRLPKKKQIHHKTTPSYDANKYEKYFDQVSEIIHGLEKMKEAIHEYPDIDTPRETIKDYEENLYKKYPQLRPIQTNNNDAHV